jgi:hypothetical protein
LLAPVTTNLLLPPPVSVSASAMDDRLFEVIGVTHAGDAAGRACGALFF